MIAVTKCRCRDASIELLYPRTLENQDEAMSVDGIVYARETTIDYEFIKHHKRANGMIDIQKTPFWKFLHMLYRFERIPIVTENRGEELYHMK